MLGTLRRPSALPAPIALGLAAALLRYVGAVWDVSWHRTVGRDTFWSEPHLLLYAGVALGVAAGLRGYLDSAGEHRRAYLLTLVGSAITLLSAPFDDYWHRTFGPDVDVWSPPHLSAVIGAGIAGVGWIAVCLDFLRRNRSTPVLPAGVLIALCGLQLFIGWFGLNFYSMVSAARDSHLYPVLATAAWLPFLVAATRQPERLGATITAASFTLWAALPMPILAVLGWRAPAVPPLILVGALALDWIGRRPIGAPLKILMQGLAFPLLLVGVEAIRFQLMPAPEPYGRELPVVAPYLRAAAEHDWSGWAILEALPLLLPVGAISALAGHWLGNCLRRVGGVAPEPERVTRQMPLRTERPRSHRRARKGARA